MKLRLLLLASLCSLSTAKFMAELTGHLTEVQCTGEEFDDFKNCIPEDVKTSEWGAVMDREEDNRNLGWCSGCRGAYPKGTFCFTVCGRRRRLEEGTSLRHLEDSNIYSIFVTFDMSQLPIGGLSDDALRSIQFMAVTLDASHSTHPSLQAADSSNLHNQTNSACSLHSTRSNCQSAD